MACQPTWDSILIAFSEKSVYMVRPLKPYSGWSLCRLLLVQYVLVFLPLTFFCYGDLFLREMIGQFLVNSPGGCPVLYCLSCKHVRSVGFRFSVDRRRRIRSLSNGLGPVASYLDVGLLWEFLTLLGCTQFASWAISRK